MVSKLNCPIVAVEEHYWDPELTKYFTGPDAPRGGQIDKWLFDFSDIRLKQMDEAGVDVQVLSHGAPSAQRLPADIAVSATQLVNDRLAKLIATNAKRFAGFAALPTTASAKEAADELERAVTKLDLKGAMLHGQSNGEFLDLQKFWPIYERAEALDVPIYFHPATPDPRVTEAYYEDYAKDFPLVVKPAWGYTVETATQAIRLVLSGIFEKHAKLKIILGHLGETLPFLSWRIDSSLRRPGGRQIDFRGIFRRNFWVTTSGFFSDPALLCCTTEMGADRVLFAIDWPFVADNKPGVEWLLRTPLTDDDKRKIASGNAKQLLKL
jgi:2,3-dihydroxybenzoate decarboxylase